MAEPENKTQEVDMPPRFSSHIAQLHKDLYFTALELSSTRGYFFLKDFVFPLAHFDPYISLLMAERIIMRNNTQLWAHAVLMGTVPRQCTLYKSIPDTQCSNSWVLHSKPPPVQDFHFKKLNPNFSGSVTYATHITKPWRLLYYMAC